MDIPPDLYTAVPLAVWGAAAALLVFGIGYATVATRRRKNATKPPVFAPLPAVPSRPKRTGRRAFGFWTTAMALLGTAMAIEGITGFLTGYGVASHELVLGIGLFEGTTATFALGARYSRIDNGKAGLLGIMTWVMALLSGVFAAWGSLAAGNIGLGVYRLMPPLVAVTLWELRMLADTDVAIWSVITDKITRIMIYIGWRDPQGRDAVEAHRDNLRRKLISATFTANMARKFDSNAEKHSTRRAIRISNKLWLAAEYNGLITSEDDRREILHKLAVLYRRAESTTPEFLAAYNPWDNALATLSHPVPVLAQTVPTVTVPTDWTTTPPSQDTPDPWDDLNMDPSHWDDSDDTGRPTGLSHTTPPATVPAPTRDTDPSHTDTTTVSHTPARRSPTAGADDVDERDRLISAYREGYDPETGRAPSLRALEDRTGLSKSRIGRWLKEDAHVRSGLNGMLRA